MPSEFTPEGPAIPTSRGKLEPRPRPLTEAERRLLRCRIREFERSPGELERSVGVSGIGVTGVLWLLTLLATDLSWVVVTAVWLVIGLLIYLWVLRDLRKELGEAMPPDGVIPADVKWELFEEWFPEPLEVVQGELDRLEESLRRHRP